MKVQTIPSRVTMEESKRIVGTQLFNHYPKDAKLEDLPTINQTIVVELWAD